MLTAKKIATEGLLLALVVVFLWCISHALKATFAGH